MIVKQPIGFIFDMDGVIIDSNPCHAQSLQEFATCYGRHLSEKDFKTKIFGRNNKEWLTNLMEKPLTPQELNHYSEEKEAIFRENFSRNFLIVPGLGDFLKKTHDTGIPMCVGTAAPKSNVDFVMEHTGFRPYFKHLLDETNVTYSKPHPEIYIKCAAALELPPHKCIVFEDSLAGVAAAKAAGCQFVGILTTHTAKELGVEIAWDNFLDADPAQLVKQIFLEK